LSAQSVGFTFTVPPHTSVGPHYAGIIVQPEQTVTGSHRGFGVRIVSRLGVRLYETVPGKEQPRLDVESLQQQTVGGRVGFRLELGNTGNTLLIPNGAITITNQFGRRLARLPVNLGTTLSPGSRKTVIVPSALSAGGLPQYDHAQVRLGAIPYRSPVLTRTIAFWTGSLTAAAAALGVLLIGLIIILICYHPRLRNAVIRSYKKHKGHEAKERIP
jgi:hypothetical protein